MPRPEQSREAFVDEQVEGWALDPDASDAMRLAWARRWNPAYRDKAQLELSGDAALSVDVELSIAKFTQAVAVAAARRAMLEAAPVAIEAVTSGAPAA
jgi:hypothetical protein